MDCRERAIKIVALKDRTEKELRDKLAEKGYSDEEIDDAVEFMKSYNYINDESYAEKYVADGINLRGHGPRRIKTELLRRGISRDIAEAALENIEAEPRERLEEIMERRFAAADLGNPKERNRIFGYFARRGYSSHDIWGVINSRCAFRDIEYEE
ncbi:MAG: regulatory protein RecX [Clostridia bacterium]